MNHASERPPPLPPLRTLAPPLHAASLGAHPIPSSRLHARAGHRRGSASLRPVSGVSFYNRAECLSVPTAGHLDIWVRGPVGSEQKTNTGRVQHWFSASSLLDPRASGVLTNCTIASTRLRVTAGRRFGSPSPRPFPRAGCWTRNARARIRPSTSHRSGRLSAAVCSWAARDLRCLLVRGPHVVVRELRGQPRESLACWRARAQRWREPTSATEYVLRRVLLEDAGVNTGPSKATQGCR